MEIHSKRNSSRRNPTNPRISVTPKNLRGFGKCSSSSITTALEESLPRAIPQLYRVQLGIVKVKHIYQMLKCDKRVTDYKIINYDYTVIKSITRSVGAVVG